MAVDYIVASLPALSFDQPAPIAWEKFQSIIEGTALCRGGEGAATPAEATRSGGAPASTSMNWPETWRDLETQLKNAVAEARGGEKYKRAAEGCSLYWKNKVLACFQEKDPLKRDEALDRVWWEAAGELTPPSAPLGEGALATYAIRLKIALKRSAISRDRGNAAFDRLTSGPRESLGVQ